MGCTLSRLPQSKRPKEHHLQFPTQIRLRSRHIDDTRASHPAMLSCDSSCDANYISNELVTKFLGEKIHPILDEEKLAHAQSLTHEGIQGYVELDWCRESNTNQWHMAYFLVTSTVDPPYDAVLGKRDAEKHGMDKVTSEP